MDQKQTLRGIILAGGTGSRFRPLTYTTAKQLLPLANKPVIVYAIEALKQAGIDDIGIVTGTAGEQYRSVLGNGEKLGVKLTYIPQEAPLGLAHAVQVAEAFAGDDPFVVFLGDNFLRRGIVEHVEAFRASEAEAYLLLKHVPNPSELGVAELNAAGRPVRLVEKPAKPSSDLAILGVYMFKPAFFAAARAIEPSRRGELEITDAIQKMIDTGADVQCGIVEDTWVDTGGPQDLLAANSLVLADLQPCNEGTVESSEFDGIVVVSPGARVSRSTVIGPAVIGRDALVTDSRIGPGTSIGDGCRIEGADIECSVLLEDVVIEGGGVRIRDSIIGRRSQVSGATGSAAGISLLLGDESRVTLT